MSFRPAVPTALATVAVTGLVLVAGYAVSARPSAAPAAAAEAAGSTSTPGITVSGHGRVLGTPNVLRLDLAVEVHRDSVESALGTANDTLNKVRSSLHDSKLADQDIKTSGLSISPDYSYDKDGPRLQGYVVTESLQATLRSLPRAGAQISAAVQAGGDAVRINGISLDLEGDSALISSARDDAVADARAKAEQYAKAAGRPLGQVVSLREQVTSTPPPMAFQYQADSRAAAPAASPVPIQAGSAPVEVTVEMVWSLG